jgi:hypothetical protein
MADTSPRTLRVTHDGATMVVSINSEGTEWKMGFVNGDTEKRKCLSLRVTEVLSKIRQKSRSGSDVMQEAAELLASSGMVVDEMPKRTFQVNMNYNLETGVQRRVSGRVGVTDPRRSSFNKETDAVSVERGSQSR